MFYRSVRYKSKIFSHPLSLVVIKGLRGYGVERHFQQYFSYFVAAII